MAGAELVKLWLSFGAQREDLRKLKTIINNINTICDNYRKCLQQLGYNYPNAKSKIARHLGDVRAYFEREFCPVNSSSKMYHKPKSSLPLSTWGRELRFEMGLRVAVLRIPNFDAFLRGNEPPVSWISGKRMRGEEQKNAAPPMMMKGEEVSAAEDDFDALLESDSLPYSEALPDLDAVFHALPDDRPNKKRAMKDMATQASFPCPGCSTLPPL